MSSKVQITGGAFQDLTGSPLANGYLMMHLSQDGQVNGNQQIASGYEIKVPLDINGNIVTSPAQYIWPNDAITPVGTFYTVSAYTAQGQLVWGPNSQMVFSSPSPYDIGLGWVPGMVSTSAIQVATYDVAVFFTSLFMANQFITLLPIERTVYFTANFSPSVAACGTNPTSATTLTLNKNGTQIGTVTINTNGTTSFLSSFPTTTFSKGDVLTIVGPSSADPTLANVGITLSGTTTLT